MLASLFWTRHSDFHWGVWCLSVGALFGVVALISRFADRNESKEERDRVNLSYGGIPIFALGLTAVPIMVVGILLIIAGAESAWEFRRLSRLGERMESWKRSELDIRGIRLS